MYKSYPKYKSSNVFWMGDIPSHWEIKKVKHVASFYTGWTPPSGSEEYYDGEYPWANISDLGIKYLEAPARTITKEAVDSLRMKLSYKGSMLFSFKLSIGLVSLLLNDTYTNEAIATFPPNLKINTSYLYYLSPVAIPMNAGVNIYNAPMLNQESIKNAFLVYPPIDEQQAIASFLDRETARIDALIQKKERMIELLKEKRIAMITQAVTKGLDPNAKMKNSGIEWLGEVPEHWEVKAIKRETSVQRGASPRPIDDPLYFDEEGEYAWVRISDVTASSMYLESTTQRLSILGASLSVKLKPGDLFVSIAGTVGSPCLSNIYCCIHDGFVYFPRLKTNAKFLYYVFDSGESYKGLGKLGTQLNLNTDTIGSITLAFPPIAEQYQIVNYIDIQSKHIEDIVRKVEHSVFLLHEYCSSLIHNAVTGKIDLRDYHGEL